MSEPDVTALAGAAQVAARALAALPRVVKDAALAAMADALAAQGGEILSANAGDVALAEADALPAPLVDRLRLDANRVAAMSAGLRAVATMPDPVGELVRAATLASGLRLRQLRVPLGVVAVIYEARPNVTVDAAGLCLKAGNAVLLRGSTSALATNTALVAILAAAGTEAGLPAHAVQLVGGSGHEAVRGLLAARGLVDVVIPRGGAQLIEMVVRESRVPVIETGVGNCHVYVDADADLPMAVQIVLNAKTSRPSVCNAAETLLVHADIAGELLPVLLPALVEAGVTVHGDRAVARYDQRVVPAVESDWDAEYLSLDLAAAVVPSLDAALGHIAAHGSGHTEAIVTRSAATADRFAAEVDAAAVMVNASTRFTDGGEFGFGAEIGISTQKLHARGPLGLSELTTTKYVITGDGHVR